jgi:nucleoside-diphosphate-sugar epimerase
VAEKSSSCVQRNRSILVVGSDGFIGNRLFKDLTETYGQVLGTVFDAEPDFRRFFLDITDPDSFSRLSRRLPMEKIDVCIHAAGTVDQTLPRKDIMRINTGGVKNLIGWLRQVGCGHLIFLSSITVYGPKVVGEGRCEDTKRKKRGFAVIPYGLSKVRSEELIEKSNVGYTLLRLPPVVGEDDTTVSGVLLKRIVRRDVFVCSREPKLFSFLDLPMLSKMIIRVIEKGPQNRPFNAASHHVPWPSFLQQFLEAYRKHLPDWECGIGKKGKLNFLFHLKDKDYLLPALFSGFGSHFPTERFTSCFGETPATDWRNAVDVMVEQKMNKN